MPNVGYEILNNDFSLELGKPNSIQIHGSHDEIGWKVTLVDTGERSLKGSRLKKIEKFVNTEIFMVTYGDGVADINICDLVDFHKKNGKIATLTGVMPPSRFGTLSVHGDNVLEFIEKPQTAEGFINGGFFVFSKKIFNYLNADDSCDLEIGVLDRLALEGELMVYKHAGSWVCMDTVRDMEYLNKMWESGNAFWNISG